VTIAHAERPAALAQYDGRTYANDGNAPLLALVRTEDRLILDVGCGAGDNARALIARGATVHGVTASADELAIAADVMARVTLADVESWDTDYPPASFDAILLSHVLEHLVDPQRVIARLLPLLRDGGRFYVALPNIAFWQQRLRLLRGIFRYEDGGIMDRTHLRFFTYGSAQELLAVPGLRVVEVHVTGSAPLRPLRRIFPSLATRIDRFCCRHAPNCFGYQVLLAAEKRRLA
jgi:SAM-dependent methyltransferase